MVATNDDSWIFPQFPQHRRILPIVSTSVSSQSPPTRPAGNSSEGPAGDDPRAQPPSARRERLVRRWVTIVATVLLISVLTLLILIQGRVSGVEFAPTHFQQREFRFYEIPLIQLQITPIRRSANTPKTANYLRVNSLVNTQPGQPSNWHLVSLSRGLTGSTPADAQLLTSQLSVELGGDDYWRKWSSDHPQHAKVLWPIVQKLAIRELYLLLPPLFEIAQAPQSAAELQARLESRLQADYAALIDDLRDSDRDALASEILAEALQDYPENQTLRNLQVSEGALENGRTTSP
jgi:hypothetical protein